MGHISSTRPCLHVLVGAILLSLAIGADGHAAEPKTGNPAPGDAPHGINQTFTDNERKQLMNFLLTFDMGRTAHESVVALLRGQHRDCALTLVQDMYGVSPETAELFIRLVGQPERKRD